MTKIVIIDQNCTRPRKVGVDKDLGGTVEDGGKVLAALPLRRHGEQQYADDDRRAPYVTFSPSHSSVSILREMKRVEHFLNEICGVWAFSLICHLPFRV